MHVSFHFYGSVSFFAFYFVFFNMCHAFITVGNQLYFGVFLFLCTMRRWHALYACKRNKRHKYKKRNRAIKMEQHMQNKKSHGERKKQSYTSSLTNGFNHNNQKRKLDADTQPHARKNVQFRESAKWNNAQPTY